MIYALRALHQERDTLLAVMDVFVKEPLLEWTKYAQRIKRQASEDWYPKQKIEFARQKLELGNPAHIMEGELNNSVSASYKEHFKAIVVRSLLVPPSSSHSFRPWPGAIPSSTYAPKSAPSASPLTSRSTASSTTPPTRTSSAAPGLVGRLGSERLANCAGFLTHLFIRIIVYDQQPFKFP